jgi:hypothetical protein
VRTAKRYWLAVLVALAACGCSDYFAPWSAFQLHTYGGNGAAYPVDATRLSVGDSVGGTVNPLGVQWYSFSANTDTTYVVSFCPRFAGTLDIMDSGIGTAVLSGSDTFSAGARSLLWTCWSAGTYYVRIKDVNSYYSSYSADTFGLSVKRFGAAYGSVVDSFEPDNARSLAAECPVGTAAGPEVFQLRRLTPGDTDWIFFSPDNSRTYTIRTVGVPGTKLCLTGIGGDTVLASDDNSGGGNNAKLVWASPYVASVVRCYFFVTGKTPGASGVYAVSVSESAF